MIDPTQSQGGVCVLGEGQLADGGWESGYQQIGTVVTEGTTWIRLDSHFHGVDSTGR